MGQEIIEGILFLSSMQTIITRKSNYFTGYTRKTPGFTLFNQYMYHRNGVRTSYGYLPYFQIIILYNGLLVTSETKAVVIFTVSFNCFIDNGTFSFKLKAMANCKAFLICRPLSS